MMQHVYLIPPESILFPTTIYYKKVHFSSSPLQIFLLQLSKIAVVVQ